MNIKHKILLIFLSVLFLESTCQNIHFSQYFQSSLSSNPSLAGIYAGDYKMRSVYRSQWNTINNTYKTGALELVYKIPTQNSESFFSTGVQAFYDKAGDVNLNSNHILPAFSFHKSLSTERNRFLSLGFLTGYVNRSFDRSKITTNSQFDGLGDGESLTKSNSSYFDGSLGMSFNSDFIDNPHNNYYLGLAYHHFIKSKNSFYNNPDFELIPKLLLSGGLKICITDYTNIRMQAEHSRQGGFRESIFGVMYGFNGGLDPELPDYSIYGGINLRWNDAIIPVIKFDYAPLSTTLSYDANISKLRPSVYGQGGFELSIAYIGFFKYKSSINNTPFCSKF